MVCSRAIGGPVAFQAGMTINTPIPKPILCSCAPPGARMGVPFGTISSIKLEILGAATARPHHFPRLFDNLRRFRTFFANFYVPWFIFGLGPGIAEKRPPGSVPVFIFSLGPEFAGK